MAGNGKWEMENGKTVNARLPREGIQLGFAHR
jgi:hypothetical protein